MVRLRCRFPTACVNAILALALLAMTNAAAAEDTAPGSPGTETKANDERETAALIDRLWREEQLSDSGTTETCDDATYLRRVFLDLLGRPATQDDVLAFCFDVNPRKRQELVRQLLRDDEFGVNWGRYWRDVVMYRRTEDRALLSAGFFTEFLTKQFNENQPWSDTARRMITATGEVQENGATGLIIAQAGLPEDVSAEVSRIFLGVQIQCAQCHDHPTDRWKREQFHELAAFFPRVSVRVNNQERTVMVHTIDVDFRRRPMNANNRFVGTLEHAMPDLNDPSAPGTRMEPALFLTGQKLALGVKDADRRGALADWITSPENPWFAKAFVTRMWNELVGHAFYDPIDDLGEDRECSAPKTLDALAQSFIDSGYDVKRLFETILATQAYQRVSPVTAAGAEGRVANCSQRLRSDQLFDSLVTTLRLAGRLPESSDGGPLQLRRDPRFQFSQVFGYDPSERRDDIAASIPQALLLMNSPLIHQAVSATRPELLGGVLQRHADDRDALLEIYVNTLGRAPTERETEKCLAYLQTVQNRREAFEDILWSLVNSTEFSHRF